MKLPRWIFGEDMDGGRQFVIHTEAPRFIAEIFDVPEGGQNIKVAEWIDAPGHDAAFLTRLMREAGDALVEYDELLEEEEDDNED